MSLQQLLKKREDNFPRPKMVRSDYVLLDGSWDFEISKTDKMIETFTQTIIVPFGPETKASNIHKTVYPDDYLHYRRHINIKQEDGFETLLHFQAIDQKCWVYLDGVYLGYHEGGYTSFSFVLDSNFKTGTYELYVIVNDQTELEPFGRGKQRLNNTGFMSSIFYTPVSGIWQSVWLETRPIKAIESVDIEAFYLNRELLITVNTNQRIQEVATVSIYDQNTLIHTEVVTTDQKQSIRLPDIKAWSTEEPNLYDIVIEYGEDTILTYVGFRDVSSLMDKHEYKRIALNDTPIFMNGVLDQGYWPDTLLTPRCDEALIADIHLVKSLGYNTMRKHVKVEMERFYYHCDRIGMYVWQDIPNGGEDYKFHFVTIFPNISDFLSRHISDKNYRRMGRAKQRSRDIYNQELQEIITQLKHYPSIVVWVPFNEGWGQFDAKAATHNIKNIDQSRLINEACGWFDQGGGDMYSIHSYFKPLHVRRSDRIVALTEFGGHALAIEGHTFGTKNFGYKQMDPNKVDEAYKKIYEIKVIRNIKHGLSAAIFTQLSDVFNEINGLITFDRQVIKVDKETIISINDNIKDTFNSVI